jgi:NhaA family Na+:H+ antiporter
LKSRNSAATKHDALTRFIDQEAAAGLLLIAAAALALIASNTPGLLQLYDGLLSTRFSVALGSLELSKPLLLWINEGLMAVFFLLVGLELKREVLEGHLSSRDQVLLPGFAAVGGMASPALVYYLTVQADPALIRGWAIPAATDIAFALGAVSILANRVPPALKVFLLTLATLDDFGAIVIIALFYTADLAPLAMVLAAGALAVLFALNRLRVESIAPYIFAGLCLWIFVVESGIHATLAGVALALAIPNRTRQGLPIISALEDALHPSVRFFILPAFAFANAGMSFSGISLASIVAPLPLAILLGLVLGKPLGILLACGLAVGSGVSRLPAGSSWTSLLGIACLAGIGFTMSLFIGSLAFESAFELAQVRLGVICGTFISASLGYVILRYGPRDRRTSAKAGRQP